MVRIKVSQEATVYEVNGEDTKAGKMIKFDSHWNRDEFVIIQFGSKRLTVVGKDLETAIDNATNTGGI